jgi:hypothetical protein
MITPDQGLDNLRAIKDEFAAFVFDNPPATEADTRAKVIDRILKESLGWPESQISREQYVSARGYQDYVLTVRGKRYITVEAKRDGIPFTFPGDGKHKYLKISGALSTSAGVKEAIEQVRSYCSEQGIRYAVATNGSGWIIFRAQREDIPWKEGQALVFKSVDYIIDNFTQFWNILSYDAVCSGSLDTEFGSHLRVTRNLHRVTDILHAADAPLQRNRLHTQLHPLITAIFEDIADQAEIEILQSCYVHSKSLKIVAEELGGLIKDEIPKFLQDEGTAPIDHGAEDAGKFGDFVEKASNTDDSYICLILGGIGSGKTTFLKRYQRTVGKDLLESSTLWFSVNFLSAPVDANRLEDYVWDTILEQLQTRYKDKNLELRKNLKNAYKSEIRGLRETVLRGQKEGSEDYENILSPFLERWRADRAKHVTRILGISRPHNRTKIVLFFDNVDQLAPAYQAKIFLLAQGVTDKIGSITIVAMREESYYTASIQNTFTAYTNHKFHIASPPFIKLIENRIAYTKSILGKTNELFSTSATEVELSDKNDIKTFLSIVEESVLQTSKGIIYFVEALCFGNMRLALEMFTTFLASGATDVGKMLYIHNRQGFYEIAYHEFVKAIMLGDRRYYKETSSPILNVFECGVEKNSSHFTTLRILHLLMQSRGAASIEGRGYVDIGQARSLFEDIFDNAEDFIKSLDRLIRRQLVEVNTRSTENSADATHVRVTSSGWYYCSRLVKSFVYLDLVLQDTPLNSEELSHELQRSVYAVNNLHDAEEDKELRVNERFARVKRFIDYLIDEERVEHQRFGLKELDSYMSQNFTNDIKSEFERQTDWIRRRIIENKSRAFQESTLHQPQQFGQRSTEDSFFRLSEEEVSMLGLVVTEERDDEEQRE